MLRRTGQDDIKLEAFNGDENSRENSVEYYKSAESYTINHPFPQAGTIQNLGLKPSAYSQEELNGLCRKAFEDWVKYWITKDDCPAGSARPHMGPGPGIPSYAEPYGTLSEFTDLDK
jgi:hypothetical protein